MARSFTKLYSRLVIAAVAILLGLAVFAGGVSLLSKAEDAPPISPVEVDSPFIAIENSNFTSIALDEDGAVWMWGNNVCGVLGIGNSADISVSLPFKLPQTTFGGRKITDVAITAHHSIVLDETGEVWVWGQGIYYCNGADYSVITPPRNNSGVPTVVPRSLFGGNNIKAVTAGDHHSVVLDDGGNVWAWGANGFGQTGIGTNSPNVLRRPQKILSNIKAIAGNSNGVININGHTLALDNNGNVWSWGFNADLQLGRPGNPYSPAQIPGLSNIVEIAVSTNHSMALDSSGSVWAWGNNTSGQVLIGSTRPSIIKAPVKIDSARFNGAAIKEIAAGDAHSMALDANGVLYTWGDNMYSQLGNGITDYAGGSFAVISSSAFNDKTVTTIAASGCNSMVITSDGSVWAWGQNNKGQVGNYSFATQRKPALILSVLSEHVVVISGDFGIGANGMLVFEADEGYSEPPPAEFLTVTSTGSLPSGNLTVTVTGTHANSFDVSPLSITSLSSGEAVQISVRPKGGLLADTYDSHNATITISGPNISSKSIRVRFTIRKYGIHLDTDGIDFGVYNTFDPVPPDARKVTVTNTGNQPTGPLTVELSGKSSDYFNVPTFHISNINVASSAYFYVGPKSGIPPDVHIATVTVKPAETNANVNKITPQTFDVKAMVGYASITLSGDHTFEPRIENYESLPGGHTATITSDGSLPTGDLKVSISGDVKAFTVSKLSIPSIEPGSPPVIFTVRPVLELKLDKYEAKITVSGQHIEEKSFTVTFQVQYLEIELSETGIYTFPAQKAGETIPEPREVTIKNVGTAETGILNISVTSETPSAFKIMPERTVSSIAVEDTAVFSVQPAVGLQSGTWTARVTVSGNNLESKSFAVVFTVQRREIELSAERENLAGTTKRFIPQVEGYKLRPPLLFVTVTNKGNLPTGTLTVTQTSITQTEEGPTEFYELSETVLPSIGTEKGNNTDTFTVQPIMNLKDGVWMATITVSGTDIESKSFRVSIDIGAYSIWITPTEHTFPLLSIHNIAKEAPEDFLFLVTNTGAFTTGALAVSLSGDNAKDYYLPKTSIPSINPGGGGWVAVRPRRSLIDGLYKATITVSSSNSNIKPQTVEVSFTVFKCCECGLSNAYQMDTNLLLIIFCILGAVVLLALVCSQEFKKLFQTPNQTPHMVHKRQNELKKQQEKQGEAQLTNLMIASAFEQRQQVQPPYIQRPPKSAVSAEPAQPAHPKGTPAADSWTEQLLNKAKAIAADSALQRPMSFSQKHTAHLTEQIPNSSAKQITNNETDSSSYQQ